MTVVGCLTALAVTAVIETLVGLAFGFRRWHELASIILVSGFTHPLLCYVLWVSDAWQAPPAWRWDLVLLETGVVLLEKDRTVNGTPAIDSMVTGGG